MRGCIQTGARASCAASTPTTSSSGACSWATSPSTCASGEERLAALLGVSRTPVREALLRLHAEGLIGPHPDGGYRPIAPDVDEVHDLYEVRMALELQALRRPAEHGTTHDLADLELLRDEWLVLADKQPEPDPGFVTLDEDFHVRLAEASGNPSLADLLRVVNERIRVVRMHDFLTGERVERTIVQHLEILERGAGRRPAAGRGPLRPPPGRVDGRRRAAGGPGPGPHGQRPGRDARMNRHTPRPEEVPS